MTPTAVRAKEATLAVARRPEPLPAAAPVAPVAPLAVVPEVAAAATEVTLAPAAPVAVVGREEPDAVTAALEAPPVALAYVVRAEQ